MGGIYATNNGGLQFRYKQGYARKQAYGRIKKAAYAHTDRRRQRLALLTGWVSLLGGDIEKAQGCLPCAFSLVVCNTAMLY